jgi:hypothetical protein
MSGETQVQVVVLEVRDRFTTYAEGEAKLARIIEGYEGLDVRHQTLATRALALLRRAQAEKLGHSQVKLELEKLMRGDPP